MATRLPMSSETWHGKTYLLPAIDVGGDSVPLVAAVWLVPVSGLVVHISVEPLQKGPPRLVAAFEAAVRAPAQGQPRVPRRIVVEDRQASEQIARSWGVFPAVKPVPLVDDCFAALAEKLGLSPSDDPKQGGRVTAAGQLEVQKAAGALWAAKPWEFLFDDDIFVVDAPGDPLNERVISVLGAAGETFGFALYDSMSDARTFAAHATAGTVGPTLRCNYILLTIDGPAGLSSAERKQPAPAVLGKRRAVVIRVAGIQQAIPHGEAEVMAATRVARAIAALRPGSDRVEVGGIGLRALEPQEGKGAPLLGDPEPAAPAASRWTRLDQRLFPELCAFSRLGLDVPSPSIPSHVLYDLLFDQPGADGRTYAERWRASRSLSAEEIAWFDSQAAGRTSVYRILGITPGERLFIQDIFTGAELEVIDRGAAQPDAVGRIMCARALITDGEGWFATAVSDVYDETVAPVLREIVARAFRLPKVKPIDESRLPRVELGVLLAQVWGMLGEVMSERAAAAVVKNTDGHALVQTEDSYDVDNGPRLVAWLDEVADFELFSEAEPRQWTWSRSGFKGAPASNTVLGHLTLDGRRLVVETNSTERADALRERLTAAGGARFDRRKKSELDLAGAPSAPRLSEAPPPEAMQAVLEMKQQHYSTWPDLALPGLGGKSPRQAVNSAPGRAKVEVMLRQIERGEASQSASARYDVGELRKALGLPPGPGAKQPELP